MREVAFTDFGYNIPRISLKKPFIKVKKDLIHGVIPGEYHTFPYSR